MEKYGVLYQVNIIEKQDENIKYEYIPVKMATIDFENGRFYDCFNEVFEHMDLALYKNLNSLCFFELFTIEDIQKMKKEGESTRDILKKIYENAEKKHGVGNKSSNELYMKNDLMNQLYVLLCTDLVDLLKANNIEDFYEILDNIIDDKCQEKRRNNKKERTISISKENFEKILEDKDIDNIKEKIGEIYKVLLKKYKGNLKKGIIITKTNLNTINKINELGNMIKYLDFIYSKDIKETEDEYIFLTNEEYDRLKESKSVDELKEKLEKKDNINKIEVKKEENTTDKEKEEMYQKLFKSFKGFENMDLPKKIMDHLNKKVIGQDEAKTTLMRTIMYNYQNKEKTTKKTCLLIGPTGSGKTLLIKTLSEVLDRPYKSIDATQLSLPGLVGSSIENFFEQLYKQCKSNLSRAEKAIVLFDEIDKPSQNNALGSSVYYNLLTVLEDTDLILFTNEHGIKPIVFNTSNLIIMAAGSFRNLVDKILLEQGKIHGKQLGFTADITEETVLKEDIPYPELTTVDLYKNNDIPQEFIGRISTIVQLKGHTVKSLTDILVKSIISPLLWKIKELNNYGIDVYVTNDYLEQVAINALETKTGARSLNAQIEHTTALLTNEILLNEPGKYVSVTLTKETALDNTKYDLREYYRPQRENEKKLKLNI